MPTHIGPTNLLDSPPSSITIDGRPFIVSRNQTGEPVLFEAICPHQGGTVEIKDEECLRCPQHGWEFDASSGGSTTVSDESLPVYQVEERDGHLYATISGIDANLEFSVDDHNGPRPTVSVLSHATLSIEYDGFRLLTDPWLDGPAFLGGWTQYPPPLCDIDAVAADTDAIWITHEHSDHLNSRTLSHFDSEISIYVPELNYRRLTDRLSELGFRNVHCLPTEKVYPLADGIEATCFESDSTWNDSILALNCGGFRILNFNDAGVNWRVKDAIPDADLIATGFSFGASGYPLTWEHLDGDEKCRIMDERNEGQLQMVEQLVDMFDPSYVLPFAKFFELFHPEHETYRQMMRKNRPSDVVDRLADKSVTVLNLLPGESWIGNQDVFERRQNRERYFSPDFKNQFLREVNQSVDAITPDSSFDLSHAELGAYFESLGQSNLSKAVGDHALTLTLTSDNEPMHALIRFKEGRITYEPTDQPTLFDTVEADTHVLMKCDGRLVEYVVRNDLSWDELRIGYWCTFERNPDEYNLAFWRLLHAPWEARTDTIRVKERYDIDSELVGIAMADILESADVSDLLAEYGLYCAGCPASLGEDVVEAARIHGLSEKRARNLVKKLESRFVTG